MTTGEDDDNTPHLSPPSPPAGLPPPSAPPPPPPVPPPPAVLVVAGTSSGVGKTTLTCGLMAALSRRGLVVQPYKCGPDFLDGMHHEAAIRGGWEEWERERERERRMQDGDRVSASPLSRCRGAASDGKGDVAEASRTAPAPPPFVPRRTVNLDGWMMGSATTGTAAANRGESGGTGGEANIRETFRRHSSVGGAVDVCIIEGCMGLYDSKDGRSDDGSTAQIAKYLNASVVLVVDASAMARSVAPMVLGYAAYDDGVMLDSVVANNVGGAAHVEWIRQAVEGLDGRVGRGNSSGRSVSSRDIVFAGGLPRDSSAAVPERHLGLTMPGEVDWRTRSDRILRLAALVEDSIDVDALLSLGRRRGSEFFSSGGGRAPPDPPASKVPSLTPIALPPYRSDHPPNDEVGQSPEPAPPPRCRIGVATDEAFCFYYADNLLLLERFGAEIVPFSPLRSDRLPPLLDALYLGGGYPELHAAALEGNVTLREDVESFANAGGVVYAECGGLMYLCGGLYVAPPSKTDDSPPTPPRMYEMCGVFEDVEVRMTPHMKMHYATIEFTSASPIFSAGTSCRGQKFHFSEVVDEHDDGHADGVEAEQEAANTGGGEPHTHPLIATPQTIRGVKPEQTGHALRNTIASYYHLHFASNPSAACDLVESAVRHSPRRRAFAVSFVSAATEIAFALDGGGECLSGVTSICDHPPGARRAPRSVVCKSSIDAGNMSSEEVDAAVRETRERTERRAAAGAADGDDEEEGPGVWQIDGGLLRELSPRVVFVQGTCHICDPRRDDVLLALRKTGLLSKEGHSNEDPSHLRVIPVAPTTLEGMLQSIDDVASSLGLPDSGAKVSDELRARLARIEEELSRQGGDAPRPRVLSLEGLAPLCTGGNWLPDVKRAAGCDDALGDKGGAKARLLSWADIESSDPDALIVSPCSASPRRTFNELHLLASRASFWKLRCVRRGEVYVIDHGLFSRPGPRLVSGVELLARLFRGVPAPPGSEQEWAPDVFKYEYEISSDAIGSDKKNCTTELSQRFVPYFGTDSASALPGTMEAEVESSRGQSPSTKRGLRRCAVTRCTIPNHPHPSARSAHCMIPLTVENRLSFIIFSGEDSSGRLNDIWKLHAPSEGWPEARESDEDVHSRVGTACVWEWQRYGKVAGEDVPTVRSNSAAVACGDYLLVFGGWGKDNVTPLAACELLHLRTLCWTHCSTRGGIEPPPRGNPTLVYSQNKHIAILFGGWDRERRLSDLWFLDLEAWEWSQVQGKAGVVWPNDRTDHTAVLWEKNESVECMIVYGGSVEGTGACSELWILDCCTRSAPMQWTWREIFVNGPSPPGRSSHTASMIGSGNDAKMLIAGGTNALTGCAKSGIVADAWILRNINGAEEMSWIKVCWEGPGIERCRHTMNVVGSDVLIWGGFDGEETVNDEITLWHGSISDYASVGPVGTRQGLEKRKSKGVRLQEKWKAEVPVREEDLPRDTIEKAKRSKLPGAIYKAIHRYAVSLGRDTYIDPASGYSVFTEHYLKRRPCCGNGCRHCPHGHVNVPKKNMALRQEHEVDVRSKNMEW